MPLEANLVIYVVTSYTVERGWGDVLAKGGPSSNQHSRPSISLQLTFNSPTTKNEHTYIMNSQQHFEPT